MNQQNISSRQATLLFVLFQIGSSFILLPSVLTSIAKQDAWISVLVALGISMLCIPLYTAIANQLQGKSLGQHLNIILGQWAGNALKFIFILCVPLFIFTMTLRDLSDFITTSVMPETPVEIIYIVMLITVYFVVRAGITVIGRSAEILFFVTLVLFVLIVVALLPTVSLEYMLPIFEFGLKPIVLASIPLLGFPYLETVIFIYLVSNMSQPLQWKKAVIHSTLISGSMFFIMIIVTTAVLSEGVTSNLTYSTYFVIRTISIADFIERFEIVITIFWYISIFFRLALLLYVSVQGLAEVFRLQNGNCLIIPLSLIAFTMSYSYWPNMTYATEFMLVYPWYGMVFGIIGPLFIWLIGKLKQSK